MAASSAVVNQNEGRALSQSLPGGKSGGQAGGQFGGHPAGHSTSHSSNLASGQTNGIGQARIAPQRVRTSLSQQEGALLGGALVFALLAVAISIIARSAPAWPDAVPVLGIGLLLFALGGGAGIAAIVTWRLGPPAKPAAPADTLHLVASLDISPNGMAIWDRYGHLIRANPNYSEFLELASIDMLLGAPREMIKTLHGKGITRILDRKSNLIETNKGKFMLSRHGLPNGDTLEMLVDISILKDREQALGDQESELRQAVKELSSLRQQSEGLGQEVAHLQSDLSREQERADDATRAKSEFLAHMSHELRTPLNAILGFADMMRGQIFGPLGHDKYSEYANDIHKSGEDLLSLIGDILDVSQIQAGDVPIDRQRIDLEKTIVDCLAMLRPRVYAAGISLMEDVERLPTVNADPMAVRQIIMHIMSNAMKFTPTGGRISVKSEIDLEKVTIVIDDTGIGIAPDIMERLGQPFAMIDTDAHISGEESSGLGIGLAVSRSLARLNGGSLTIESEEGYGTTARLILPRR